MADDNLDVDQIGVAVEAAAKFLLKYEPVREVHLDFSTSLTDQELRAEVGRWLGSLGCTSEDIDTTIRPFGNGGGFAVTLTKP